MKKRLLTALTIWGGIDATICAGLLIYSTVKALQIDRDNHKWALEMKASSPAVTDEMPEVKIQTLGKAFKTTEVW